MSSQTDILPAARMLGHAHAQVTAWHYARAGEDAAERAAEAPERELLRRITRCNLPKTCQKGSHGGGDGRSRLS